MIRVSEERDKQDIHDYLVEMKESNQEVKVHHNCRRKFTDSRKKSSDEETSSKRLRSSLENKFNWKTHCVICEKVIDFIHQSYHEVMTLEFHHKLAARAKERDDEWGKKVLFRLDNCNDLVAEEAKYHHACITSFWLWDESTKKKGRPIDSEMSSGFEKLCTWLEERADCELYTLKELQAKMEELNNVDAVYTVKRLKQRLMEHYKDDIYFAELSGRVDVVCFKDMANYILYNLKKQGSQTKDDTIVAAAKMIRADIQGLRKSKDTDPSVYDIAKEEINEWVPPSMQYFLQYIIPTKLKRKCVSQCITQASRPRSLLCPVPFGSGVELESSFGSKWLINHLHRLGLCISYDEVVRYKGSAIEHGKNTPVEKSEAFVQWVADNVDHNIVTLTGQGTFHGLGMISIKSSVNATAPSVPRFKQRRKTSDFIENKGIKVKQFLGSSQKGLSNLKFDQILNLMQKCEYACFRDQS